MNPVSEIIERSFTGTNALEIRNNERRSLAIVECSSMQEKTIVQELNKDYFKHALSNDCCKYVNSHDGEEPVFFQFRRKSFCFCFLGTMFCVNGCVNVEGYYVRAAGSVKEKIPKGSKYGK